MDVVEEIVTSLAPYGLVLLCLEYAGPPWCQVHEPLTRSDAADRDFTLSQFERRMYEFVYCDNHIPRPPLLASEAKYFFPIPHIEQSSATVDDLRLTRTAHERHQRARRFDDNYDLMWCPRRTRSNPRA